MGPQENDTPGTAAPHVFAYDGSMVNDRDLRLFTRTWEPHGPARALVFIAHGYAEHCLLYDKLARILASHKIYVFSHDHVGHGQSEGPKAMVNSFDEYVDDVFKHVNIVMRKKPNLKCFLCGHSMGGAICILSALRKSGVFSGVVLIGPAVETNPDLATPFRINVAKCLRWICPQFPVATLDLSLVSSDPQQVKVMKEDKLRYHGRCKAGFGASLIDACKEIQQKTPLITFPFLLLQGKEDKLCLAEGAEVLHKMASSKDRTIKIYPNAFHSLLYEPNGIAEQVMADILEWLLARI